MTEKEQNIAIALTQGVPANRAPRYTQDLNAMRLAELSLIGLTVPTTATQVFDDYIGHLYRVVNGLKPDARYHWSDIDAATVVATAAQRAEAFLKTLNLWTA